MPIHQRGYLTQAEFESITGRSAATIPTFTGFVARAEALVDQTVGAHHPFHHDVVLDGISAPSSTTIKADEFDEDKDDFYNNLRLVVKQGPGKGDIRRVVSFDAATKTATIDTPWSTLPTADSVIIREQVATFPRHVDRDADHRPVIPEEVTLATAAVVEFLVDVGGTDGLANKSFSTGGSKTEEGIGEYSVKFSNTNDKKQLIGNKAFLILGDSGLVKRTGRLVN